MINVYCFSLLLVHTFFLGVDVTSSRSVRALPAFILLFPVFAHALGWV